MRRMTHPSSGLRPPSPRGRGEGQRALERRARVIQPVLLQRVDDMQRRSLDPTDVQWHSLPPMDMQRRSRFHAHVQRRSLFHAHVRRRFVRHAHVQRSVFCAEVQRRAVLRAEVQYVSPRPAKRGEGGAKRRVRG